MRTKTSTGALAAMLLAACAAACTMKPPQEKRFPTSKDFPPTMMGRSSFAAGGGHGWRISTLATPSRGAAWKIVIITGTPSWSEYWAPTLARVPAGREMIVADRPGFALSEPEAAVTAISDQADALAPMAAAAPGQKVVIVGQSYGAPVAALIAARHPDQVQGLVLMSGFFGARGPTARRLVALGAVARPLLPRDLKNALAEVRNQEPQLPKIRAALAALPMPVLVLHGGKDTFVPPAAARALAEGAHARYVEVASGDHFLNACCVSDVLAAVETVIAEAEARPPAPAGRASAR